MNNLLNFLKLALSPNHYATLVKDFRARTVYLYYALLTFLILAIPALVSLPKLGPAKEDLLSFTSSIPHYLPEDAKLTLENGTLTTNLDEPFTISSPDEKMSIITIDTSASLDDFKSYDTFVLINDQALIAYDDNNQLRVISFDEFDSDSPLTLTHDTLAKLVAQTNPKIDKYFAPVVISFSTLGIILGTFAGTAFAALWYTLLISLLLYLGQATLTFRKKFLLSSSIMFLMTIWNTVWQVFPNTWPNPLETPFLTTTLVTAFLIPAINSLRDSQKVTTSWRKGWSITLAILLGLLTLTSLFS